MSSRANGQHGSRRRRSASRCNAFGRLLAMRRRPTLEVTGNDLVRREFIPGEHVPASRPAIGTPARSQCLRWRDRYRSAGDPPAEIISARFGDPFESYREVMTTLPRLCALSTYLCASTMSSRA